MLHTFFFHNLLLRRHYFHITLWPKKLRIPVKRVIKDFYAEKIETKIEIEVF